MYFGVTNHELARRDRRALVRGLVLVCCTGLGLSANAQGLGFTPVYEINGGFMQFKPVAGGGFERVTSYAAGELAGAGRALSVAGNNLLVTDALTLAGRGGALPVSVPATIAAADGVAAIAAVLSTGPGAVIVGAGVAAIVGARIYRDGGLHWDVGQSQAKEKGYECVGFYGGSPQEACTANLQAFLAQKRGAQPAPNVWTFVSVQCGPTDQNTVCTMRYAWDYPPYGYHADYANDVHAFESELTTCPAVVDASDPRFNVAKGSPPGPDGKCRSARYNHIDMTPAQAAAKVMENPPPGLGDQIKQGLQDMWNPTPRDGSGIQPKPDQGVKATPGPASITGPTSQPGQPGTTTTTGPGGTTTTTTTPQYNYTYSPTTITYNTTTTVTTINPQGDTTTTTTNPPPVAPQDPNDPCTQHPDTLACMKLGDAPDDKVPKRTQPLTYTDEAIGLPSGCPDPIALPHGLTISYDTACAGAQQMRPFVIMAGLVSAMWICLGVTGAVGRKE